MSATSTGRANAAAKRTKAVPKSVRAGVLFPVARLHRYLKRANPKRRVSVGASVYAAAVIEYLAG
jgi:histone H2A